jgi:hypothetical protein
MAYTFGLTDFGPDDHSNTTFEATPLDLNNGPLAGELEVASDVDVFRVATTPNTIIRVATAGVSLQIWSNGFTLAQLSSAGPIDTAVQVPGSDCYLLVRPRSPAPVPFMINATVASDDFTAPTALVRGSLRTGNIDFLGDTDTFTFAVATTGLVDVTVTGARAEVRDPFGFLIGNGDNSTFSVNATTTGTFTVKVLASPATPNGIGAYSVLVP